jgi:glycosyltransferase involved in cell wall biosynthesis
VPVVASATGGLIEDVPRVDGILVPCPNPASLAAAIAAALGRTPRVPEELDFSRLAGAFAAMYAQAAQAASLPPTAPAFAGVPNELR